MQSNNSAVSQHSAGSDSCENPEIEIQYPELPINISDEWLGDTGSSSNQANENFRNNLIKLEINIFDVKSSEDVSFQLIEKILVAQKLTTNALLNSKIDLEGNFIN